MPIAEQQYSWVLYLYVDALNYEQHVFCYVYPNSMLVTGQLLYDKPNVGNNELIFI